MTTTSAGVASMAASPLASIPPAPSAAPPSHESHSLDGGESWIALPSTNKASTTIAGLRPGARVWVRYRTVIKSVTSDWSNVQSIIVS